MIVILSILLGILILRLLLPFVALYFANRSLAKLEGHRGHIKKITINLLRGHYTLEGIALNKSDSNTPGDKPFFTASRINVSIQWKALFHKSIVVTVVVEQPEVNLKKEKAELKGEAETPSNLKRLLQNLLPFNVNLGIKEGTIHYVDHSSKAKVDLAVTNLTVCVREFSNMKTQELVPARISASANVYQGALDFTMTLYPMMEQLTFDMNAELKKVNLVLLNEFFRAYAKIDINKGTFSMYTEVAAKDGGFKGYVKPIITNLDIIGVEDRDDSLFTKLWERLVAGVYQIIKNKKEDQVAAKIPIEGRLDDPRVNIFVAVVTILQNAFIRALHPSLDDVINIASVRASVVKAKGAVKKVFNRIKREKV